MTEIKIEKNVPLPACVRSKGQSRWSKFEVGDSAFFPGGAGEGLPNSASQWGRLQSPKRKFSRRTVTHRRRHQGHAYLENKMTPFLVAICKWRAALLYGRRLSRQIKVGDFVTWGEGNGRGTVVYIRGEWAVIDDGQHSGCAIDRPCTIDLSSLYLAPSDKD